PDDAFAQAKPMIVPEPTAPLGTPLSITEERWGRIPRYYIECLADKAIPPEVQKAMYMAIPVKKVFSMNASHAPNFSAPQELAEYLLAVAAE
ncbi:MAG: alpha/beta hydrolase, partial [Acidobacteriota bacterium]